MQELAKRNVGSCLSKATFAFDDDGSGYEEGKPLDTVMEKVGDLWVSVDNADRPSACGLPPVASHNNTQDIDLTMCLLNQSVIGESL